MSTDADSPDPTSSNDPPPNPWDQPPQGEPKEDGTTHGTDWDGADAVVEAGIQGTALGGDLISAAAAEGAGAAIEGAGSALEALGGAAAEGCSGCALVVLITLFAAAGSAMAFFR